MKNNIIYFALLLAVILLLSACQPEESMTETPVEETASSSYTVTDDRDMDITFEQAPEKIVSLIPSNTEIVFALDEGGKLIGVTDYDNYPVEAAEIERVSDSVAFNAERIIEMNPDVVLAYSTGEAPAELTLLEDADIPVFVIQSATSFEEVYGDIEQIASVLAVEEKGSQLIEEIQTEIEEVQQLLARLDEQKEVYFEISPSPEIYTAGQSTFQQEILNHAQIENVFGDLEGWPNISEEEVIVQNPEVILTTVSYVEDAVGEIKARDSWSDVEAIQNEDVYFLDSDIMSRPGPRIGEAVRLAAEAVYPELMDQ